VRCRDVCRVGGGRAWAGAVRGPSRPCKLSGGVRLTMHRTSRHEDCVSPPSPRSRAALAVAHPCCHPAKAACTRVVRTSCVGRHRQGSVLARGLLFFNLEREIFRVLLCCSYQHTGELQSTVHSCGIANDSVWVLYIAPVRACTGRATRTCTRVERGEILLTRPSCGRRRGVWQRQRCSCALVE